MSYTPRAKKHMPPKPPIDVSCYEIKLVRGEGHASQTVSPPPWAPRLISFAPSTSFLHLFPGSCSHCWGLWSPLIAFQVASLTLNIPLPYSPITLLSSPHHGCCALWGGEYC